MSGYPDIFSAADHRTFCPLAIGVSPLSVPHAPSLFDHSGPVHVAALDIGFGIATLNNSEDREELP